MEKDVMKKYEEKDKKCKKVKEKDKKAEFQEEEKGKS
jgi:hypothetical protein